MSAYCSMIHGGLVLDFKQIPTGGAQHCCLIAGKRFEIDIKTNFWNNPNFDTLRSLNKKDIWDDKCFGCKNIEDQGSESLRTGTNQGLIDSKKTNFSGPLRIDLMFDIRCNLACRSCGVDSSTFWQKHLKDNGLWNKPVYSDKNKDRVITALSNIDLSNLKQLVFCGGETLLGKEYWEVTQWLADNVPNAKEQLTVCFQTNGTQPIPKKYFDLIERFHLVKLQVSLDGATDKFEYLRWPASWNQVTDNLLNLRAELPSNVMFLIEETISIFNLFYQDELDTWVKENFATNREGDITNHTRHLAVGIFNTNNVTTEYKKEIDQSYFKPNWKENPQEITKMVNEIKQFDLIRKQSFAVTFPQVAKFYTQYLTE